MSITNTLSFLSDLSNNNNKPWFEINRKRYESAKKDWEAKIAQLITSIAKFDPAIGELEVKNCTFRINRDVRFSKDKSPYKTNFGASFSKGGKKIMSAGYYVHLAPNEIFIAGGMWMPEPPYLNSIRQEIDYHLDEFKKIVENPAFLKQFGKIDGEKLSNAPKGFDKESPALEYLKLKSYVGIKQLKPSEITDENFVKITSESFKELKPLCDFINKAINT
jgi:uncharacterized protein (TIGR02453 family)